MEYVEAPSFTRYLSEYLTDDEYRRLQILLTIDPERGDVMPGTGGFRKLRWTDPKRRKGRRGGLRIIYYFFATDQQIWLMTLYGKDEAADLTPTEKKVLKNAIDIELQARQAKWPRRGTKSRRTRNE
jgi:hypothetical protein